MVGMIDPNMIVPAFLTFSYEHKFKNGWIADVILPKQIYLRKGVMTNGRFSIGSELSGSSFYFYNQEKTYSFSQMEINSGVLYDHCFGKSFIGSFKTGLRYVPMSRISEKNQSVNDYISSTKPKPSLYFNLGVSYNLFK